MRVEVPDVRVGEPMRCGGLALFPLFAGLPAGDGTVNYVLAHEAMAEKRSLCRRCPEEGEVPFLLVDNRGEQPVLFVEGEEVCGGRQNRVLCGSILAAGRSQTRIPVVCTQHKRWESDDRQFAAGSHCPPSLRHVLKDGHRPDQSRIWTAIRRKHRRLGRAVGVGEPLRRAGDAPGQDGRPAGQAAVSEGASGIAVALGGRLAGMTCSTSPRR